MTTARAQTGVLLVAHGSSTDPSASDALRACAQRLKPHYADVALGIWKEPPGIVDALAQVGGDALVVVPFVMSEGWFSSTIVPPLLALSGFPGQRRWEQGGRSAWYARPIGASPAMPALLASVLRSTRQAAFPDHRDQEITALLVGHGTPRNPHSKDTLDACVARLRSTERFAATHALWVDDDPRVETFAEHLATARAIVLPFFAGAGPHVSEDIPRALGFSFTGRFGQVYTLGATQVAYAAPLGTHPELVTLVHAAVDEALEGLRGQK